jgi:uncharacterized protein YbjT (DUF2867 family)
MILVAGGTGTVGSELVRILSERGARVRALVRDPERAAAVVRHGVETVRGDLSDPATLQAPLEGCDHVFLLSPPDPSQVAWQGNLIEAAKAAGTKPHVVKLSVIGAALDAPFRIGRWHAQTERHLEDSELPWTHLRPGSFVQNFFHHAGSIARDGAFHQPAGGGRVAYVDARDVAEAAARVLLEPGHQSKVYELTGAEALAGDEVAACFSAATGRPVRYVSVSADAAAEAMRAAGMTDWYVGMLLELFELQRNGASARITPTLRTLLGRPPRTVDRFARDHAAAFGGS